MLELLTAQDSSKSLIPCSRKLLLWSLVGVTAAMLFLGGAFRLSEDNSPPVALDSGCPGFDGSSCTDCIRQVLVPNTFHRPRVW